jgi:hypothetical protein
MDEEDIFDEGVTGGGLLKKRNERRQQESEVTKRHLENQKMTDLSMKIDDYFNSNLRKLMLHMKKSHANYDQNLMNLYQKLDYYGYYSRQWDENGHNM